MAQPKEANIDEWLKRLPSRPGKRTPELVYEFKGRWQTRRGWITRFVNHRHQMRNRPKTARDLAKRDAFQVLGNKCVQCGFTDKRALQIDHVYGNGKKDRSRFSSPTKFYLHVKESYMTGEYQILCANCNIIKRIENKEHGKPRFA